jgi:hypothetical protein
MNGECGGRDKPAAETGTGNRDFTIKKRQHANAPSNRGGHRMNQQGADREFQTSVCYQQDDIIFYHI